MRLISRSYREDNGRCARRSYYRYLYRGSGFDSATPRVDLGIGIATHEGMASLMRDQDPNAASLIAYEEAGRIFRSLPDAERESHSQLCAALVMGWWRARGAAFFERFKILRVETEIPPIQLAPSLGMYCRTDVTVEEIATGQIFVINWKTTGEVADWASKWNEEVQAWTEAMAEEDFSGQRIDGVIFMGLFKGVKRDGVFLSRLTYGYRRQLPSGEIVYSPVYAKGWERFPVWLEFPGGLEGWIAWIPEKLLEEMFPESPPILKDNGVVEEWIRQLVRYETDAQHILDSGSVPDQEAFFRQEFSNFNCKWCVFKPVCFRRASIDDLIEMGKLIPREDHHARGKK